MSRNRAEFSLLSHRQAGRLSRVLMPVLVVLLLVLQPGAARARGDTTDTPLPVACTTGCVSPYGTVLGTAPGNVPAYSNCRSDCVVFTPNRVNGVYTGIRWQCVEFARRWLLLHKGAVYGDVDVAADIWDHIDHLERVRDHQAIPLTNFVNGSAQAPALGDLLIYAKNYLGTGHVAVVTGVDLSAHQLRVAEENYRNRPWPGDYARTIEVIRLDDRYWVLDPYLLGWKHAVE